MRVTKECNKCKRVLPIEEFHRRKVSPDGLQYACKRCQTHFKGREKYRLQQQRTYIGNNRDAINEKERLRYANSPWYKRRMAMKRYMMKLGTEGSHTPRQFLQLCEMYEWKCRYCNRKLDWSTVTEDHAVPLSRGGSDDISNIRPCCKPCNSRKCARTETEFTALPRGGS